MLLQRDMAAWYIVTLEDVATSHGDVPSVSHGDVAAILHHGSRPLDLKACTRTPSGKARDAAPAIEHQRRVRALANTCVVAVDALGDFALERRRRRIGRAGPCAERLRVDGAALWGDLSWGVPLLWGGLKRGNDVCGDHLSTSGLLWMVRTRTTLLGLIATRF